MAMTLSDAQKLSARVFNEINEKLDVMRGKGWDPFIMVTDLLEEAGEVASTVKGLEGFKPPEKTKTKQMLATELSDLLYIIFVLAEHYNLDLEEHFSRTIQNYKSRFLPAC